MKSVTLYTCEPCTYCHQAKKVLTDLGFLFTEIKIGDEDNQAWEDLYQKSGGMRTLPQVYFEEKFIGGFSHPEKMELGDGFSSLRQKLRALSGI